MARVLFMSQVVEPENVMRCTRRVISLRNVTYFFDERENIPDNMPAIRHGLDSSDWPATLRELKDAFRLS